MGRFGGRFWEIKKLVCEVYWFEEGSVYLFC